MITENYVSFEVAKLLREKGFREVCSRCYGIAVLHNGVHISVDEEFELKHEGRGNEIEYVEGGMFYDLNYKNSNDDADVWSAPTLWGAMKWLREVHNVTIVSIPISFKKKSGYNKWKCELYIEGVFEHMNSKFSTYEDACEAALKYCLINLIK